MNVDNDDSYQALAERAANHWAVLLWEASADGGEVGLCVTCDYHTPYMVMVSIGLALKWRRDWGSVSVSLATSFSLSFLIVLTCAPLQRREWGRLQSWKLLPERRREGAGEPHVGVDKTLWAGTLLWNIEYLNLLDIVSLMLEQVGHCGQVLFSEIFHNWIFGLIRHCKQV